MKFISPTNVLLSRNKIGSAVHDLKGRGIVDLSMPMTDGGGNTTLYVKPGGIFQRLRAWFSGASERKEVAKQVCARLQAVLGTESIVEGLLNNVKKQILNEGRLTGDYLARNLDAFQKGEMLVSVKDIPTKALGVGQQIRVLSGSPTQIESDRCIVSSSTAIDLLKMPSSQGKKNDQGSLESLTQWEQDALKAVTSSISLRPIENAASKAKKLYCVRPFSRHTKDVGLNPAKMNLLIRSAIGNATGAIVIEPQPDKFKDGELGYSDEGLKAQIKAALEKTKEAEKSGQDRVITFVSPDKALLKRIQSLYAERTKNSAEESDDESQPVQRFALDSESDSDSSEDEPLQLIRPAAVGTDDKPDDDGTSVFPRP